MAAYLLFSQDAPHLTHYIKKGDLWTRKDYADLDAAVELPSIACQLSLCDGYEGVVFK